jgi:hypothetical protein
VNKNLKPVISKRYAPSAQLKNIEGGGARRPHRYSDLKRLSPKAFLICYMPHIPFRGRIKSMPPAIVDALHALTPNKFKATENIKNLAY